MSSRVTRPRTRPVSMRTRRQRIAAGAVLATTGLLGTYLAAIRPQPTYASQGGGVQQGQGLNPRAAVSPMAVTLPTCAQATVTVTDDTQLRNAISSSDDTSVICISGVISLLQDLPSLDDTSVTFVGATDDSTAHGIDGQGNYLGINADFTGASDDSLIVNGLSFTNLLSPQYGGAIFVESTGGTTDYLYVGDSTFNNNTADWGGAIGTYEVARVNISGIYASNNDAIGTGGDGGAVQIGDDNGVATNLTISDSTFIGNKATNGGAEGGAVSIVSGSASIIDSVFNNNETVKSGGAVRFAQGVYSASIEGSFFSTNTASLNGGAIYSFAIDPTYSGPGFEVTNSTFVDNKCLGNNGKGGAIHIAIGSGFLVSTSVFTNNNGYNGGAIYAFDTGIVSESLFSGNDSDAGYGGALNLKNWVAQTGSYVGLTEVRASTFVGNGDDSTPWTGGAIYKLQGYLTISNSLFDGNKAVQQGGGIYIADNGYDDTVTYSTLINNEVTDEGAGLYVSGNGEQVTVQNSLFYDNNDTGGTPRVSDIEGSGGVTLLNSTYTSATSLSNMAAVVGSIYGDPNLQAVGNNGGPSIGFAGTYLPTSAPLASSIAVGRADPDLLPAVTTDQVGTSRRTPSNTKTVGAITIPGSAPTPPTPPPTYPPSAPLNVTGTGGDRSATISWTEPSSSGSFPITDYQVVLAPGGATCLVQAPALSCTIDGLTNGTEYTATARALNGSGWGPYSTASEPFTPENPTPPVTKTIVITGSRTEVRGKPGVQANGTTTGLVGATVQARVHLAGEVDYYDGSKRTVNDDGTFVWSRRTGKKTYVFFTAEDGTIRSNRVVIQAN